MLLARGISVRHTAILAAIAGIAATSAIWAGSLLGRGATDSFESLDLTNRVDRLTADQAAAIAVGYLADMAISAGGEVLPRDLLTVTSIPMSRVGEAIPGSGPTHEEGLDPDRTVWVIHAHGTFWTNLAAPGAAPATGSEGYLGIDDATGGIVIVRFRRDLRGT
jgi:hypothetical protein